MVSIDRYFTVMAKPGSFLSKFPFGTTRSAFLWSLGIMFVVFLVNIHLLIMSRKRYYNTEELIFENSSLNTTEYEEYFDCEMYESGFRIYPEWENIHLVIYNCIPFGIMSIFNGLLIKNILIISFEHRKSTGSIRTASNKRARKRHVLTLSLVLVTALFLVMTFPNSILYGFFIKYFLENLNRQKLLILSDHVSFANQCSILFSTILTYPKFRRIFLKVFKINNNPNSSNNSSALRQIASIKR